MIRNILFVTALVSLIGCSGGGGGGAAGPDATFLGTWRDGAASEKNLSNMIMMNSMGDCKDLATDNTSVYVDLFTVDTDGKFYQMKKVVDGEANYVVAGQIRNKDLTETTDEFEKEFFGYTAASIGSGTGVATFEINVANEVMTIKGTVTYQKTSKIKASLTPVTKKWEFLSDDEELSLLTKATSCSSKKLAVSRPAPAPTTLDPRATPSPN